MAREDGTTLVERYVREVLVEEKYDAIDELYAVPFDEPKPTILGGLAGSIEELRASYAGFHEHVSISDVNVRTVHATGTEELALWLGKTEYHEPFQGIRPAGKPQLHEELTRLELDDGRIDSAHHLRDTLETVPPAARAAHSSALSMLETGVVAVDRAGDIVLANPAVLDVFSRDRDEALGTPVEDLLGTAVAALEPGETTELSVDNGQRTFEVLASTLRDERYGVTVGRFLLLHDVTERKRRIQRLQVLNRVLRHNLRNDLAAIVGRAEFVRDVAEGLPEQAADALETIVDVGRRLSGLGVKASEAEEALSQRRRTVVEQDLTEVVDRLVERAREEYPDVAVAREVQATATVEATRSLQTGLWALVENACEHNDADDPRVEVTVERRGTDAVVTVADNGPGIPEQETAVIRAGEETSLEHGSGIGLWLARWVVETSGGDLSFADAQPRGSTVTVTLPAQEDGGAGA